MTYQEYKEKIAEILYQTSRDWSHTLQHNIWKDVPEKIKNYWLKQADQILSLFYKPCDEEECKDGIITHLHKFGMDDEYSTTEKCSYCKGEGYIRR